MMMWIIDILIGLISPLLIPGFDHWLYRVKKPYIMLLSGKKQKLEDEKMSIFFKEFPTAFIGNAIWGMTYQIKTFTETNFVWVIAYAFIALLSYFLIMYSNSDPNPKRYKQIVVIIYTILCIIALFRIFYK
jgi:hypothetical protein